MIAETDKMPLIERYRPKELTEIYGQPGPVAVLEAFAENPYPCAFLFHGGTGTGKTSAAYALARALGCDVAQAEFGGFHGRTRIRVNMSDPDYRCGNIAHISSRVAKRLNRLVCGMSDCRCGERVANNESDMGQAYWYVVIPEDGEQLGNYPQE